MRLGRIIALVLGSLLVIPALAMTLGGGALGIGALVERDDDGYFDGTMSVETDTIAVTAEDLDFITDPGEPDWIIDSLDVDIRLRVTNEATGDPVFVGIARERDLDQYLAGVAHAEIRDVDGRTPEYRLRTGDGSVGPPADETFWFASSAGVGTQEIFWEAQGGQWAAIVMNADGSPGVSADVNVGARSGIVVGLAVALLAIGSVLTLAAVALIIGGARSDRRQPPPPGPTTKPSDVTDPPTQRAATYEQAGSPVAVSTGHDAHPVSLSAALDPNLNRSLWLVKWFLAIPHFIVLTFLWIAFVVLTIVAGVAILFTGRYPRGIFDFNVGVLRWSWRVQFYAWSGGLGTDTYPPFSLHAEPGDPAHLDVAYPEKLNQPLVLVKWLLAIPHLIIVGLLAGSSVGWFDVFPIDVIGGFGLLGILTLTAGVILLFTNRYPTALFDMIVGLNRWVYRVVAYVALMTDEYPPFRLDQGGTEPTPRPPTPANGDDWDDAIDLTAPQPAETPEVPEPV